jgi:hypothetical protein
MDWTERIDRWMIALLVGLGLMALAGVVFADGPLPEVDPGAAGSGLADSIAKGLVVAAIIFGGLLVVYFLNLFLVPSLKGKAKAVTATILVGLAGFLFHKSQGHDWVAAIVYGLTEGLSAGKAWDLLPEKAKEKMKAPIKAKAAKKAARA